MSHVEATASIRHANINLSRLVFIAIVLAFSLLGEEFDRDDTWFQPTALGVPLNYILFFVSLLLLAPYVLATPSFSLALRLDRLGVWKPTLLGWGAISLAIVVGILRSAPELFADWRNLLIMSVTATVAAKWLAHTEWRKTIVVDLAIAYGLSSLPTLITYFAGGGVDLHGVQTTVYDGTTLYTAAFATATAAWNALVPGSTHVGVRRTLLNISGLSASLLVLLSFRRSFWITWIIALAVVAALAVRKRGSGIRVYVGILAFAGLLLVATVSLGADALAARVGSISPTATGEFAVTNRDHVNDIIDAWRVVERDPILGLGIGFSYETELITAWKKESFDVHNAVLHVWLKFGLLGVVAYLIFHFALVRAALRSPSMVPIAAFVIGEFVATTFGTWPYGSFQMSVFHGVLIAIIAVNYTPVERQATRGQSFWEATDSMAV